MFQFSHALQAYHPALTLIYKMHAKATPRGFEPLRAEPNGFRVHLLNRSDTVSCRRGASDVRIPSCVWRMWRRDRSAANGCTSTIQQHVMSPDPTPPPRQAPST